MSRCISGRVQNAGGRGWARENVHVMSLPVEQLQVKCRLSLAVLGHPSGWKARSRSWLGAEHDESAKPKSTGSGTTNTKKRETGSRAGRIFNRANASEPSRRSGGGGGGGGGGGVSVRARAMFHQRDNSRRPAGRTGRSCSCSWRSRLRALCSWMRACPFMDTGVALIAAGVAFVAAGVVFTAAFVAVHGSGGRCVTHLCIMIRFASAEGSRAGEAPGRRQVGMAGMWKA